jgi:shikimate kinase
VRVATEAEAPQVISCGGGVIMDPENRARLVASSYVAWLRAEPETLARRVERSYTVRPLLAEGSPIRALVKLAAERDPIYEAVADVAVSTDRRAVDDIAASVVAAWQARL